MGGLTGEEEMGLEKTYDQEGDDDDDEYGSQYDQVMGLTGFNHDQSAMAGTTHDLKKKKKKKQKKKKKKPVEYEDPSLREHLLAGAYGGVAKKKIKRDNVRYTTDINAGLRDIATPASVFTKDPRKFFNRVESSGGGQITGRGKKERLQSSTSRS